MSKKCKRDKSLIAYIYFLYILHALIIILPRRVSDIPEYSSPESGQGIAVVNLNGFSVAVYCILVMYQKKLSMPRMTL